MSAPTEVDFALIKMGDNATPTEAFVVLCGLRDVTINSTAQTTDRTTYDCAKPNAPGARTIKTQRIQQDITGSGLTNADMIDEHQAALGRKRHYRVECYRDDGTDSGALLGTIAGTYVMTATNMNLSFEGQGSAEVTLSNDGAWTWTAAA